MSSRINTIRDRMRAGFSAAHLLAFVALFVALSGIAYASVPRNSVKSSSIRDNKIKSVDVRDDSLTGDDINESTLTLPNTGGGGGSSTPSGPAGGDLAGTYPNPTIANNAITGAELANDSVVAGAIAANSVTTSKINDSAVTTAKLGSGAVTKAKIAPLTLAAASGLANSWQSVVGVPAQHGVDAIGIVHLRGQLTGGTLGQTAFTLPAGERPSVGRAFPVSCGLGQICIVTVDSGGNVAVNGPSNAPVFLDGVDFQAEQ